MTAFWVAVGGLAAALAMACVGDLVSEEVRSRLDRLPYRLIRLAARRLPWSLRSDRADEWEAELHEILRGTGALPITRLVKGTRYAIGLLRTASSIGHQLANPRPATISANRTLPSIDLETFGSPRGYRGRVAMHAAGVSYRQLDYWARTGLVEPSLRPTAVSGGPPLYSLRDLVLLRVAKSLLEAGVSLQNIRKAIDTLRAHAVDDLAGITLMSDGITYYEARSPADLVDLLQDGQGVFGIAIGGAFKKIKSSLLHLPGDPATDATRTETGAP